jgi:cytochrome c biogenesis protein CcmG, thiol:disulfide interchange protein DsbE
MKKTTLNNKAMKTRFFFISMCFLAAGLTALAQNTKLPDVPLYTLDGQEISASAISNEGMPLILTCWKTTEADCCEQLLQLYNTYDEILQNQGVKMIAICIDGSGCTQHVKPFVYGHDIDIDIYIDKNGDFKRAMGISDAPYTILYDNQMQKFCQHAGACSNIDDVVCHKVNECLTAMSGK